MTIKASGVINLQIQITETEYITASDTNNLWMQITEAEYYRFKYHQSADTSCRGGV